MSRTFARRASTWLAAIVVIVLVVIAATAISRWWHARGPVQKVVATTEQLQRGRYLALAADCAACHTSDGGAPFAGGVPLNSPFGTLHGTNITPDPEHGIGRYTADDFFDALTEGKARDGHPLYPAMPYVSYRRIPREDSDAMYAWLMNQPAVNQPNAGNEVRFPANIRTLLHGWKLLFARRDIPPTSQGQSPQWQRGRYLVDTLGHCGECHTPRGVLGQLEFDRTLHGNADFGRLAVPDITPAGLAERGWDAPMLQQYLSTGISPRAVASDEMLKLVNLSTSRMDASDIEAMTTYLLGDRPRAAKPFAVAASTDDAPARRTYFDLCAGCHGRDGEGVPNVAPGLRDNSGVREADPHNLIVAMLDGLPVHDFPGLARMQDMPAFAGDLDDAQIAALATWLRQRYGGQRAAVEASAVRELRDAKAH
jgi:mono/diheme cytochrome c family protein